MVSPVYRQILAIMRPYAWPIVGLVLLGLLASLAEGFGIGLVIPFVDNALAGTPLGRGENPVLDVLQAYTDWLGSDNRLLLLGLSIVLLVVCKSALAYAYSASAGWIKARAIHDLRCQLFARLLGMDYQGFVRQESGTYYNVVANETWRTTDALTAFFTMLVKGCTILVFGIFLVLLSWQLTLFALLAVAVTALVLRKTVSRARHVGEVVVRSNNNLADALLDMLTGMRTIRAFVQERDQQTRLEQASASLRRSYFTMDLLTGLAQPLVELVYLPIFLLLIVLASFTATAIATLVAFLLLLYRLIPYVKEFENNRVLLARSSGSLSAVMDMLRHEPAPPAVPAARPFGQLSQAISFRHVGFRYGTEKSGEGFALQDVSFDIPCGKTVALIGPSGGGKSTLIDMLYGFYRPADGEILVDGTPLHAIDRESWRRALAFAGQDAVLFRGTIAENIAFARPAASRDDVREAARSADAEEFIRALPDGLDTRVGRGGLGLSGGQRQRIALARALLAEPQLLILDEATNAVDNLSERALQRMLQSLAGRMTVVIIAHRLQTVRHADWVVVMGDGRVVEQGEPGPLLDTDTIFARLYRAEIEGLEGMASGTIQPVD